MTTKLYLLYDYEEHGPENLVATLDPHALPKFAEQRWPAEFDVTEKANASKPWAEWSARQVAKYGTTRLTARMVLERWIEDGCPEEIPDLSGGWGGPELLVVTLDEWSLV